MRSSRKIAKSDYQIHIYPFYRMEQPDSWEGGEV